MIYAVGFTPSWEYGARTWRAGRQSTRQHRRGPKHTLVATAFGIAVKFALVLAFALLIFALLHLTEPGIHYLTVLAVCPMEPTLESFWIYPLYQGGRRSVPPIYEYCFDECRISTDASVFLHAPEGWLGVSWSPWTSLLFGI